MYNLFTFYEHARLIATLQSIVHLPCGSLSRFAVCVRQTLTEWEIQPIGLKVRNNLEHNNRLFRYLEYQY